MNIEYLKLDFDSEIGQLHKIHSEKISYEYIFVGSGDSYASRLIAEFVSGHKCRYFSSSDLFNSRLIPNKTYCFVSVNGKTTANKSGRTRFRTIKIMDSENVNHLN